MFRYIAKLQTSLLLGVESTADRGATAVEYGLLVALVAGLLWVAFQSLGGSLDSLFVQSTSAVVVGP